MKRDFLARLVVIAHCIVIAVFFATRLAQARPSSTPPNGNLATPLYTDSRADAKAGPLTISNTLTANTFTTPGSLTTGYLCLPGGGCRNYWPDLSQPNWNIDNVLAANPYVYGKYMYVGSITLGNVWRYTWPYYGHTVSPSGSYTIYNGIFCPNSDEYVWGIGYDPNTGWLGSISCAHMTITSP